MVYPPTTRESTNRSSVEAFNCYQTQSTAPSILLHQPQLYTPFNPVYTCAQTNLTPPYIYNRRNSASSSITLRGQDSLRNIRNNNNNKWLPKSQGIRIKDYTTNQHPVPYVQPPLMLYDPLQNYLSPTPSAPLTPVYHNQTTSFHPNPYLTEPYANLNPNLITQPFYKPSELQTYCLMPDQSQNQYLSQQTIQQTYYNIPTNLQNVKLGLHSSSITYPASERHEDKLVPVITNQLFPKLVNSAPNLSSNPQDKIEQPKKNLEKIILRPDRRLPYTETLVDVNQTDLKSSKSDLLRNKNLLDEKYSDESSCFDFTIEAEKMVSALCNSSFYEPEKDEDLNEDKNDDEILKKDENSSFNNNKEKYEKHTDKHFKPWYLDILDNESKISTTSVGIQTLDLISDEYPELIRKTINWGCNEAEKILKNIPLSSRQNWLHNLSIGTKTACTKSSTCFPIFSGDEILSQDLINAVLRISNGWLILDHYFNKQHQPSLNNKFDNDLIKLLKNWELSTHDLLKQVIETFIQLGNNINQDKNSNVSENLNNTINSSFPGDVCLYVNFGLFGESLDEFQSSQISLMKKLDHNQHCNSNLIDFNQEKKQYSEQENKLRTKWTITERPNLTKKLISDKSEWNLLTKENFSPQHTLQYDFFLTHPEQNINEKKLQVPFFQFKHIQENYPGIQKYSKTFNFNSNSNFSTAVGSTISPSILPNDDQRPFWNLYSNQTPLCSNFLNDNLNNNYNKLNTEIQKSNFNDEETINLSAWFASMRNRQVSNIEINSSTESSSNWWESSGKITLKTRDSLKNERIGSFKNDINRQIQTLKNMRTIQTAPWIANQLVDDKNNLKCLREENDSSEDARVYMKPGSYNVPKKKYQSRRSQRRDELKIKNNNNNNSKSSQNCFENKNLISQQNPTILSRKNITSLSSSTWSRDVHKDVTWKAACASAELLLDSLKVASGLKIKSKSGKNLEEKKKLEIKKISDEKKIEDIDDEKLKKSIKKISDDKFELSPSSSLDKSLNNSTNHFKTNIKTDSWLIKTLNDASNEENNKNVDTKIKELNKNKGKKIINCSSKKNYSENYNKNEEQSFFLETSHTIAVMTLVDVVGKATYSETVRRYSSSTKPTSKVSTQGSKDLNKRKNSLGLINDINNFRKEDIKQETLKMRSDKIGKSKKNQIGDRSWSVWYSSRRKQHNDGLGPLTLGKLVNIHRVLWRMDLTRVFKCPTSNTKAFTGFSSSELTIENYRKVVKNPMFLETIGYKLKNHVYRKVDHVIKDFRRIVHNSILYHKNNKECMAKIKMLSKKLEELVEIHFSDELCRENLTSLTD